MQKFWWENFIEKLTQLIISIDILETSTFENITYKKLGPDF